MLGLNPTDGQIAQRMITTTDVLPGFEIDSVLGPVEGVVEMGFTSSSFGGLKLVKGGELENMLFAAKQELAKAAFTAGANAVIAFRYAVLGRELEKSVIAYGTAVKCRKT